jgi:hypothetical protein
MSSSGTSGASRNNGFPRVGEAPAGEGVLCGFSPGIGPSTALTTFAALSMTGLRPSAYTAASRDLNNASQMCINIVALFDMMFGCVIKSAEHFTPRF